MQKGQQQSVQRTTAEARVRPVTRAASRPWIARGTEPLEPRVLMAAQLDLASSLYIPWSVQPAAVYGGRDGDHWVVDPASNAIDLVQAGITRQWNVADLLPGSRLASSQAAVTPSGMLWFAVRDSAGVTLAQLDTSGQIAYNAQVLEDPLPDLPIVSGASLVETQCYPGPYLPGWYSPASISIAADAAGGCWYAGTTEDIVHLVPGRDPAHFELADSARISDFSASTDGGVWFAAYSNQTSHGLLGSISADGQISYITRSLIFYPTQVASGPDSTLYFAFAGHFGWSDADGTLHDILVNANISELLVAPDGRPWLLDSQTLRNPLVKIVEDHTPTYLASPGAIGAITSFTFDTAGKLLYIPHGSTEAGTIHLTTDLLGNSRRLTQRHAEAFTAIVGSFFDPTGNTDPSVYGATVRFGDGDPVAAIITANAQGGFDVTASATLPFGDYDVQIQITDQRAEISRTLTIHSALMVVPPPVAGIAEGVSAETGQPFSGAVARFVGIPDDVLTRFRATINWGDGQTSDGELVTIGDKVVAVRGTHTYAKPGFYNYTVDVRPIQADHDPLLPIPIGPVMWDSYSPLWMTGPSTTAFGRATVGEGKMVGDVTGIQPIASLQFSGPVARFSLTNPQDSLGQYRAEIDWGEPGRAPTAATLEPAGSGQFDVVGNFVFTSEGSHAITVRIYAVDGSTATVGLTRGNISVASPLSGSMVSFSAVSGVELYTKVGTISSAGSGTLWNSHLTVIINWGDNQSSEATLVATGDGTWDVYGRHTYDPSAFPRSVYPWLEIKDQRTTTATGMPADTLTFGATIYPDRWHQQFDIGASQFTGFRITQSYTGYLQAGVESAVSVALFLGAADMDLAGLHGQILWDDGEVSEVAFGTPSGRYLSGITQRTFADAGQHTGRLTVTLGDFSQEAEVPVLVSEPVVPIPPIAEVSSPEIDATKGVEWTGTVARFRPADPADIDAFTAMIYWGDGTQSQGTISADGDGWYKVRGSHTYTHTITDGWYSITLSDGQGSAADASTVTVTLDPTRINATGTYLRFRQREQFTSVVATFTAPNQNATAADFQAWIDWGDGQRSRGVITRRYDGSFDVSGTVTYHRSGSMPITVTVEGAGGPEIANSWVYLEHNPIEITPSDGVVISGLDVSGELGSFIDEDLSAQLPIGSYIQHAALVDWGDGEISWGTIQRREDGTFDVRGNHHYAASGDYTVRLVIRQNRTSIPSDTIPWRWSYGEVWALASDANAQAQEQSKDYALTLFTLQITDPQLPVQTVQGTNRGDVIRIRQNGNDLVVSGIAGGKRHFAADQIRYLEILGLKGNDRIIASPEVTVPLSLLGGAGHDTLLGGNRSDTLYGGDGADRLNGGIGGDWLYGESGNDVLKGGPGGANDGDFLSGGAGRDTIRYSGRIRPSISLDSQANDGVADEHDNVQNDIEWSADRKGRHRLTL